MQPSLLLVEDNRALSLAMSALAERCGFEVSAVPSLARAEGEVSRKEFAVILLDIGLPDGNGLTLLEQCAIPSSSTVAVVTAHGEIENAIAARKLGVAEFFDKPIDFDALAAFLNKQGGSVAGPGTKNSRPGKVETPFIGASKAMRSVFQQVAQACASSHPVVIRGAGGSGRSHVARLIQGNAGIDPERCVLLKLAEEISMPELDRAIQQAEGGALVIEELSSLSLARQGELVERFDRLEETGARLIVITDQRELRELVLAEELLPDLYYRIQVLEIILPDLADRAEDIPALVSYFVGEQEPGWNARFSDELYTILQGHDWPGNLRELRNVVNYLLVAGAGYQLLTPSHLPSSFLESVSGKGGVSDDLDRQLSGLVERFFREHGDALSYRDLHDELEGRLLTILMERFDNKQSRLAEALSMNRVTLRKKLRNRSGEDPT